MAEPARPVDADADGIRVHALARAPTWRAYGLTAALLVATAAVLLAFALARDGAPSPARVDAASPAAPSGALAQPEDAAPVRAAPARARPAPPRRSAAATPAPAAGEWPSGDPNDLASHFAPGDPEPTMGEVIQALRDAGVRTGIAAFNPPGTSPPLIGLAVPADYELPPGYVRHHQVTDAGEPLEPILMYSPDHVFVDASGRPVAVPEDRVVPPERAPPGLPLRRIELPRPDD